MAKRWNRKELIKICLLIIGLLWILISNPMLTPITEFVEELWWDKTTQKSQETITSLRQALANGTIEPFEYEQFGIECIISDTLWIGTFEIPCTDSIVEHPSGIYLCLALSDTVSCAIRIATPHNHLHTINKPLFLWKVKFEDGKFSLERDGVLLPALQVFFSLLIAILIMVLLPEKLKLLSVLLFILLSFISVDNGNTLFSSGLYGISIITPSLGIIIIALLSIMIVTLTYKHVNNRFLRLFFAFISGYSLYVVLEILSFYPYFPMFTQLPLLKGTPLIIWLVWLLALITFVVSLRQTIRFFGVYHILAFPVSVAVFSFVANTISELSLGIIISFLWSVMHILWYEGFKLRRWLPAMISSSVILSLPISIYITISVKEHVSKQLKWLAEESVQWRDPLVEFALLNNEPIENPDFIQNEFLIDSTEKDILLMGATQVMDNLWFRWKPLELSISYIHIGDTIDGMLKVRVLKKFLSPFSPFTALLDYDHSLPLPDLSIALYERDTLLIAKGSYPYPYRFQPHDSHGYWLHAWVSSGSTALLFSLPFVPHKETFQWFVFITLLVMAIWVLRRWRMPVSIHRRFAIGFVGATTVLFAIIGILLMGFFDEEQSELQRREVRRWLEVGSHQLLYDAPASLSFTLSDADIALYDELGWLSYTSQPVPFLRGLKGFKMPYAIWKRLYGGNPYAILTEGRLSGTSFVEGYRRALCSDQPCFLWIPSYGLKLLWAKEVSWWFVVIATLFILSLIASYYASRWLAFALLQPVHRIREALLEYGKGRTPRIRTTDISPELKPVANAINTMIEQRERWHEQQIQLQRLKGWQSLARQAVHEIRNLLTPMKLLIQKNILKYKQNNQIYSDLKQLEKHIERMEKLSNDFSSLSRLSKPDSQPVPIHKWINEFVQGNPFPVELNINVEEANVMANTEALSIIFRNILKNAIEANATKVDIYGKVANGKYVLEIKDNGSGMDTETLKNIFLPEFTSKSSGMGVGMAIVKHLITSMKGDIEVFSEEGQGTTVVIYLPVT
ncbi:MAG: HAMP domain-containing histidine kinase [Chlorobi bacterium]|nr:HAMP domain-containing histidine kinase [Chlorobiota bacterium]